MNNTDYWELFEGIATEIAANVVWIVLAAASVFLYFRFRKISIWVRVSALRKFLFLLLCLYLFLSGAVYFGSLSLLASLVVCTISSTILGCYFLYRFSRIGVLDAYPTTTKGLDYHASLVWSKRSFDFLGVGAHKLTSDAEFSRMVTRCSDAGRPIRLLLSPPANPVLQKVANRSGSAGNAYEKRVKDSLKIVSELVRNHGRSIQVRSYKANSESDYHQFRMVFIDDKYCILSFTIWDNQEGRSNPQLIIEATDKEENRRSIYYAFRDYFERLWNDENTREVDLSKYR